MEAIATQPMTHHEWAMQMVKELRELGFEMNAHIDGQGATWKFSDRINNIISFYHKDLGNSNPRNITVSVKGCKLEQDFETIEEALIAIDTMTGYYKEELQQYAKVKVKKDPEGVSYYSVKEGDKVYICVVRTKFAFLHTNETTKILDLENKIDKLMFDNMIQDYAAEITRDEFEHNCPEVLNLENIIYKGAYSRALLEVNSL